MVKRGRLKKTLAAILSAAMVLSSLQGIAFAAEPDTDVQVEESAETQDVQVSEAEEAEDEGAVIEEAGDDVVEEAVTAVEEELVEEEEVSDKKKDTDEDELEEVDEEAVESKAAATVAQGSYCFEKATEGAIDPVANPVPGMTWTSTYRGDNHGMNKGKVTLNLADDAVVVVLGCCYDAVKTVTAEGADGEAIEPEYFESEGNYVGDDKVATNAIITAPKGTLSLDVKFQYIHGIKVLYGLEEGAYSFESGITGSVDPVASPLNGMLWTAKYRGDKHGLNAGKVTLNLTKRAKVTVKGCSYDNNKTVIAKDVAGKDVDAKYVESAETYPGDDKAATNAEIVASKGLLNIDVKFQYIHGIVIEYLPDEDEDPVDRSLIDVWDFGGEQLDTEVYRNKLSVSVSGQLSVWTTGDPKFAAETPVDADGEMTIKSQSNVRLYSTNEEIKTKYGVSYHGVSNNEAGEPLEDEEGNPVYKDKFKGYFYINGAGGSTWMDTRHLILRNCAAGDVLTIDASTNGAISTIHVAKVDDLTVEDVKATIATKTDQQLVFHIPEDGDYIIGSEDKLVVARVTREHPQLKTVSGNFTSKMLEGDGALALDKDAKLVFKNDTTGATKEVEIVDGKYSVKLVSKYSYSVELTDSAYPVTKGGNTGVVNEDKTLDIVAEQVELTHVSGNLVGISSNVIKNLKFVVSSTDENAKFKAFINAKEDLTFDGYVQKSITNYTLSANDVDDYTLKTVTIDGSKGLNEIVFEAKALHKVTVNPVGVDAAKLANATVTLQRLDGNFEAEKLYVYTFKGMDDIQVRDGQYKITVVGVPCFWQLSTADVKVNGADTSVTVPFKDNSGATSWDFSAVDFQNGGYTNSKAEYNYNNLEFVGGQLNKTYLLSKAGTVKIPVKKDSTITIKACYEYVFKISGSNGTAKVVSSNIITKEPSRKTVSPNSVDVKTGSTGNIDTFTIEYTGGEGYVVLDTDAAVSSYFCSIAVDAAGAGSDDDDSKYRESITVGAGDGYDYETIGDALEAVAKMSRPNDERVTLLIAPGNYEEMPVINVKNVTFKNAAEAPSIALKNKGVDIDDNAVRITSYYGTGYSYYSMGADYKYSEEELAVNKANGYYSTVNKGDGTATMWNSTVVLNADGFEADGIIFENSFNRYVSEKAANDIIVPIKNKAKEPADAPRASLPAGSTEVQKKVYVERACAFAAANNVKKVYFNNCKFVGHQDILYGGTGCTMAFEKCDLLGGTDYIMGAMAAVFNRCNLVINTDGENKNDVAWITAPQQGAGAPGYLFFRCYITQTTPGVDTAAKNSVINQNGFGRPWDNNGQAVFYKTKIGVIKSGANKGKSLIDPIGWNNGLTGGTGGRCGDIGTIELSGEKTVSTNRTTSVKNFCIVSDNAAKLPTGEPIAVSTFLGDWDANGMVLVDEDRLDTPEEIEGTVGTAANERETATGSADDKEANVLQTATDTLKITEMYKKGKVKSFALKIADGSATEDVVTINAGAKFTITGDVSADKKAPTVFTVTALDGADAKVVSKAVNKKGVVAPKVIKDRVTKKAVDYSFEVSFVGASGNNHKITFNVINPSLVSYKDKAKSIINSTTANKTKVVVLDDVEDYLGAAWYIGADKIPTKPGKSVKVGKAGAEYATVTVSADNKTVTVTAIDGAKGKVKVTANINGKKYTANISIINK